MPTLASTHESVYRTYPEPFVVSFYPASYYSLLLYLIFPQRILHIFWQNLILEELCGFLFMNPLNPYLCFWWSSKAFLYEGYYTKSQLLISVLLTTQGISEKNWNVFIVTFSVEVYHNITHPVFMKSSILPSELDFSFLTHSPSGLMWLSYLYQSTSFS